MKSLILFALLLAGSASAQITGTNAFDLASVASTTANGTAFQIVNVNVPQRYFFIQNNGISGQTNATGTGTNSLAVAVQMSFDGTNWSTIATYKPSRTNAAVDTFSPSFSQLNAYMRVQVTTTNTITVGVTAVKP
jgi:hypothetical protein